MFSEILDKCPLNFNQGPYNSPGSVRVRLVDESRLTAAEIWSVVHFPLTRMRQVKGGSSIPLDDGNSAGNGARSSKREEVGDTATFVSGCGAGEGEGMKATSPRQYDTSQFSGKLMNAAYSPGVNPF